MKPGLLIIGDVTERMMARFEAEFTPYAMGAGDLGEISDEVVALAIFGAHKLENAIMDALPNLKVIANYGVGYDGIDAVEAARRGILVSNTPDVLNDEVANTAIMLWLAVARRLVVLDHYVREGRWVSEGNPPLTRTIQNRTVGILGLGRIGQAIADRLQVFGATILYHSRNPKDVPYRYCADLTDMAKEADCLIVITPGGSGTRHLVNREVLDALGPDGILINVARGSVVDEAALVVALTDGRLGGAGLDVFEAEPHVPEALFAMENVVLQPHIGSATVETRQAMGDLVCDNLSRYLADGTVITPVPECAGLID